MGYFKDVTPESAGISSKGILNFLDRIEENQIELHSFMVIRHGQCAAKGWWKPYDEKFRHPLYSFSKSLTATAIGFAEQEGILSLDEKIVDIFPDLLPENPSENLKKITLHHLLIMGCGHETEIMDNSENWISTFLHHPVLHEPGTFYKYNTFTSKNKENEKNNFNKFYCADQLFNFNSSTVVYTNSINGW